MAARRLFSVVDMGAAALDANGNTKPRTVLLAQRPERFTAAICGDQDQLAAALTRLNEDTQEATGWGRSLPRGILFRNVSVGRYGAQTSLIHKFGGEVTAQVVRWAHGVPAWTPSLSVPARGFWVTPTSATSVTEALTFVQRSNSGGTTAGSEPSWQIVPGVASAADGTVTGWTNWGIMPVPALSVVSNDGSLLTLASFMPGTADILVQEALA